jgi:hypothetical protein
VRLNAIYPPLTQELIDDICIHTNVVDAMIKKELNFMPLTKDELKTKIRATLTRTAQQQAMPIHRDVLHYFTDALADELFVPPPPEPIDPEKIEGIS